MDDRTKLWGTCFMSCQAFCMISKPPVNSNWSNSPETLDSGQNRRHFLSCVTFKFYRWHWKTIRHLFYAISSFVYHFIAIGQFKRKLQFGNAQCGSKLTMFCLVRPWNLRMIVKNERVSLLALCFIYSFTVTVRKRLIWVKIGDFLSRVTLKFGG